MADYIIIKRHWQDIDFFQLEIECKTDFVIARGKIYTTNEIIDDLYNKIEQFLSGEIESVCWRNGTPGDSTSPCIMFVFSHKDKLGHVLIEVFMELDDGGPLSAHNCCFYVNTEIGLLHQFKDNLMKIKVPQLGIQVSLSPEEKAE